MKLAEQFTFGYVVTIHVMINVTATDAYYLRNWIIVDRCICLYINQMGYWI